MVDYQPQKLSHEDQVRLVDGSLRLTYPVSSLSINGKVLGNPSLGGLSQLWLTQETSIFNQVHW